MSVEAAALDGAAQWLALRSMGYRETRTSASPFSLVSGGACVRLLRARGSRFPERLGDVSKMALALAVISWLPLLATTLVEGTTFGGPGSFASDVGAHARFLLALPLAVVAELPIGRRLRHSMRYLVEAGLIEDTNGERASAAVGRAERMRDSFWAESSLAAIALALSSVHLSSHGRAVSTWAIESGEVSVAGGIYLLVSAPLFRFVVLRWMWRLIVWTVLLAGLARAPLRVDPAHPDRAGGLSVVACAHQSFGWISLVLGVSLAGNLWTERLLLGRSVTDYTAEIVVFSVASPLIFLAPLLVFAVPLEKARRRWHASYGSAAADFARRWGRDVLEPETRRPMEVDTAKSSAHTDMVTSFDAVRGMRALLVTKRLYVTLLAAAALPMLAFVAQEIPLIELLGRVRDTIG